MNVICPHCKATLDADIQSVGQNAECGNCGRSFIIQDAPARIALGFARAATHKETIILWLKSHVRFCLYVIGAILLVSFLWIIQTPSNRYVLVKGDNGVVYRTDKRTGETVMIRGSTMRVVAEYQPHVSVPTTPPRELRADELLKITGRGGVGSGSLSDYFSGTIYNGVSDIDLRSIKIAICHKNSDGERYERVYQCELGSVGPLKTTSFHFNIIRGEEESDYSYPWRIVGAMGVSLTK